MFMQHNKYRPRTLVEVCTQEGGEFYRIWNGNVYCGVAGTRGPVDCPYCDREVDKNNLYLCTFPVYNQIRDMILYYLEEERIH